MAVMQGKLLRIRHNRLQLGERSSRLPGLFNISQAPSEAHECCRTIQGRSVFHDAQEFEQFKRTGGKLAKGGKNLFDPCQA